MLSVRPKVAELAIQLYGRSLHPELFKIYKTRQIERGSFSAKIDVTSAGHVVTWRYAGVTLTEVAAAAHHPLPKRRRLMSYRLRGEHSHREECRGGVIYDVRFQLEPVDPEFFWTSQRELAESGETNGLLHRFDSSGRMALGALSYVNVETRERHMSVQAFHTFPDDHAIVKIESRYQLPKR